MKIIMLLILNSALVYNQRLETSIPDSLRDLSTLKPIELKAIKSDHLGIRKLKLSDELQRKKIEINLLNSSV